MSVLLQTGKRKDYPVLTGVIDFFPDALLAVAEVSRLGNEQHTPGRPLHRDRKNSPDTGNSVIRHLIQRGTRDTDGGRHLAKACWQMLALLQDEIEAEARIATAMAEDVHNEAVVREYINAGMGDADRRVGPKDRRVTDYDVRRHTAGDPWPWDLRGDGLARAGAQWINGKRHIGRRITDPEVV